MGDDVTDTLDAVDSLADPQVRQVLERLHAEARAQTGRMARAFLGHLVDRIGGRRRTATEEAQQMRDLYLPISAKQGSFLYAVTRAAGARRVVEFGTSFGISTIYLAAAVRDTGGGKVIGSELEPSKVRTARANVDAAGLSAVVEIREGDACETLRDPGGPVDLLFVDGWKDLYVPVVEILRPHLRPGALVVADNMYSFWSELRPYRRYMQDPANGFRSVTVFLSDGMECSVRL